ncbi:gamma-glutamyl-gamma-aminobutyrate hydrolase family protein [Sphingomonas azotifigens]|uniref:gamma-glutamyl-gamma-aminobutyrate hydrolase family protein n=1 Tax=Sphingomonas azotifigens TaxID=330920 RepID=UPI00157D411E|nr:gamma-glutamyl-gamma-aminobutyrate hydrolase family protein [Sphingomonas azotifigens]
MARFVRRDPAPAARRPVIGVLCCNEVADRPIQAVASRFIEPLSRISGATVLLVPALVEVADVAALTGRLDGLLLTGSRSDVEPHHYGGRAVPESHADPQRDRVALALAERMIESGRPVFGICRGLQEINVLFGGSLRRDLGEEHHRAGDLPFEALFDQRHDVTLTPGGLLGGLSPSARISVNSVHREGIGRLGDGLAIEACSPDDGLIEAISARPCGAEVLAVQWHPEWDGARAAVDRAFFERVGASLGGQAADERRSRGGVYRGH